MQFLTTSSIFHIVLELLDNPCLPLRVSEITFVYLQYKTLILLYYKKFTYSYYLLGDKQFLYSIGVTCLNLNRKTYLAIFLIATSIVVATTSTATQASADKPDKTGLEKADEKVHENTGSTPENPSDQDIRFHEGTCQGGHTTEVLESIGGCGVLTDPGNSDENRQDDD
jgi:hypothetical protein